MAAVLFYPEIVMSSNIFDGFGLLSVILTGTVPVYWGDSEQFKALLPDPKAAIFVSDYKGNIQKLAQYLTYLSNNETAYEEHRNWRKTFDSSRNSRENIQLRDSWECKVCNWAVEEKNRRKLETSADIKKRKSLIKQSDRCKKVP